MARIFEQLDLDASVPLNPKTITEDRTALEGFQIYRGLVLFDKTAPAGVYVYGGVDGTNVAASWTRVDASGGLIDQEDGTTEVTWDSEATLAFAEGPTHIPGRIYEVDVPDTTFTTVPIGFGGTGATNATDARTNLGITGTGGGGGTSIVSQPETGEADITVVNGEFVIGTIAGRNLGNIYENISGGTTTVTSTSGLQGSNYMIRNIESPLIIDLLETELGTTTTVGTTASGATQVELADASAITALNQIIYIGTTFNIIHVVDAVNGNTVTFNPPLPAGIGAGATVTIISPGRIRYNGNVVPYLSDNEPGIIGALWKDGPFVKVAGQPGGLTAESVSITDGTNTLNITPTTQLGGGLVDAADGDAITWDSVATLAEATEAGFVENRVYEVDIPDADVVPITLGGTGATTLVQAQTNLGITAGVSLAVANTWTQPQYFEGHLRVGGNDASHQLEDYEEGTWTPVFQTVVVNSADYTKIGRSVILTFTCNPGSGLSGNLFFQGLPFTPSSTSFGTVGAGATGGNTAFGALNKPIVRANLTNLGYVTTPGAFTAAVNFQNLGSMTTTVIYETND